MPGDIKEVTSVILSVAKDLGEGACSILGHCEESFRVYGRTTWQSR
jgi:hypothetical protein